MYIKTITYIKGINTTTQEEITHILPGTICEVFMKLGTEPNKYYLCESSLCKNVFVPIFKGQCIIVKNKKGNDILSIEKELEYN